MILLEEIKGIYGMKNNSLLRMGCMVLTLGMVGTGLTGCSFTKNSDKNSKSDIVSGKETKQKSVNTEKTNSNILPVKISYEYPYKESDGSYVLNGKYPVITLAHSEINKNGYHSDVADPGYDNAKKGLVSINDDIKRRHTSAMDEHFSDAASMWKEEINKAACEIDYTAETERADKSIISLSETDYYNLGGAHPSTEYRGINIDTQTGKSLVLSDITTDMNKLAQVIADTLRKNYPDIESEMSGTSLENQIKSSCDNDYDKIQFTISYTGITVIFSAETLAGYAAGPQFVNISFSDNQDLFNKKYIIDKASTECFREIPENRETKINDDGEKKLIWNFAGDDNDVDGENRLAITYNGVDYSFEQDGFYSAKCFMASSGKTTYLYIELSGDNDYRNITVYRIKNGKINHVDAKADGESGSSGFLGCGFYDDTPYNTDNFIMQKRVNLLSTMYIAREYELGDDGVPTPKTDYYYYNNEMMKENPVTLTTKAEIEMTKISSMASLSDASGKDSKKKIMIPSKTKLTLFGTDAKSYVILKSESGELYRVDIETGSEGGNCTVGGKKCEDLFDGMFYAG